MTGGTIVLLVEGATETAVKPVLKRFLDQRCEAEGRPKVRLDAKPVDSDLLSEPRLRRRIEGNLARSGVLGVVALIDVVCSGRPRQFEDAGEAIAYLRRCGPRADARFRPHAAQYDFEAWLLPYWDDICRRLRRPSQPPGSEPERVNHQNPPSKRLQTLYRLAGKRYDKPRDATAILDGKDLTLSASQCPQFRALLTSLLELAGCSHAL